IKSFKNVPVLLGGRMFYLVTGGAGFIGSNLASALLAGGRRIRVLDNFLTGKRENLAGLAERYGKAFELVEGDLRDLEVTRRAAEGAGGGKGGNMSPIKVRSPGSRARSRARSCPTGSTSGGR